MIENWLPNGSLSLKRAKEILGIGKEKPMPTWPGYQPRNTIKIQLTEDDMTYLVNKLYGQLKAVLRETGEDLIRQSVIR